MKNTQSQSRKTPKNKSSVVETRLNSPEMAACGGYASLPVAPRCRSDTVDLILHHPRPEKAECDYHACQRTKGFFWHVKTTRRILTTDVTCASGRTTTGNATR
jgi:hypothetical protein